jgi:hypothetical protein
MITAFIPARGGSKTVPGKNIKEFAGKPLIIHSIEYALQSKLIEEVVVSTDNSKITRIANSAGARVINRPEELAILVILELSVDTTTSSISLDCNAYSILWMMSGFPANSFIFFPGTVLLPPRAGIKAVIIASDFPLMESLYFPVSVCLYIAFLRSCYVSPLFYLFPNQLTI